jgi:uncharacterized membrane protein
MVSEDGGGSEMPEGHGRLTLAGRLRAYFFAGILFTAPISITFYIAWLFIDFVDRQVTPLLPSTLNAKLWGVPGVGLLLVVVALTLVGALTAGFLGRVWMRFTEAIMGRTPVLRGLYSAIKQIFETVLAQKSQAFREVALIEYPRRGIWTIAFITGRTTDVIADLAGQEMVNVFVPTTPNPTSGFLLFLPKSDLKVLDMAVEDGLKLVISGGIVTPPERLTDKAWDRLPLA